MSDEPKFESGFGNCDVQRCVNPAKYHAKWPDVSKLVCETHKKHVADKSWPEVSLLFGSKPPR